MTSNRKRWLATLELAFFTFWAFTYIWIVLPLNNPVVSVLNGFALFAFTVASHLWRGTPAEEIGLRFTNFLGAVKLLVLPTLIGSVGLVILGFSLGLVDNSDVLFDWLEDLVEYPIWGFIQQYAFQGYILVRAVEAGGGRKWPAIVLSAALYTLVHAPNAMLLVFCFPVGLLWSWVFSRRPNLYAVALSHGILGATMKEFFQQIYWAGLRVGPHLL